jgi:HAD superfamily hydrolase (TIGR01509 family)
MTAGGVLFDLDGVLVDSASLHALAYERVFSEAGLSFPQVARSAVLEGKARSAVIDLALPAASAELKRSLADAKPDALEAILERHGYCGMPGATETVRALGRAGVAMAVVTNSRAPQIWLSKLGIATQIRTVVTGDDVASPKPAPEGYLLGAARLGVDPARCLAIEDSHDGWLAAKDAGMRVAVLADEQPEWLDASDALMRRLDVSAILQRLGRA